MWLGVSTVAVYLVSVKNTFSQATQPLPDPFLFGQSQHQTSHCSCSGAVHSGNINIAKGEIATSQHQAWRTCSAGLFSQGDSSCHCCGSLHPTLSKPNVGVWSHSRQRHDSIIAKLQTKHPNAVIIISGVFNDVTMEKTLTNYIQYVSCPTTDPGLFVC